MLFNNSTSEIFAKILDSLEKDSKVKKNQSRIPLISINTYIVFIITTFNKIFKLKNYSIIYNIDIFEHFYHNLIICQCKN